jgi:hypothetical protein
MKNLFLFVAIATLAVFSSCSSDDDKKEDQPNATSELKVTINGAQKTFNTIQVSFETAYNPNDMLVVTASINNNPLVIISFIVQNNGAVGANALFPYQFSYTLNGLSYSDYNPNSGGNPSSLSSIVQTNNSTTKKLSGTFSGTVYYWNNNTQTSQSLNLTNGSFNISY